MRAQQHSHTYKAVRIAAKQVIGAARHTFQGSLTSRAVTKQQRNIPQSEPAGTSRPPEATALKQRKLATKKVKFATELCEYFQIPARPTNDDSPASSIGSCKLRPERCPAVPTERPAYPCAQPACAGIGSEPPYPAQRRNQNGNLSDCPHRLNP